MSALLDSLLDPIRLADVTRNDAALGFPPAPPVEMDEFFFARSDLDYARARDDGSLERRRDHWALESQQQRLAQEGRL
jgi:hypothetical protein